MGPLEGCTLIELGGIGPAPFAAMLLADMCADVINLLTVGPDAASVDGAAEVRSLLNTCR